MKRVLFSTNEGEGIITEGDEVPTALPLTVKVVDEQLTPGTMTTLKDFFNRPLEYLGTDAEYPQHKKMIFHIGTDESSLFPKRYYKVISLVSPKRLFIMFRPHAGRDFNFIKGQWK